MIRHVDVDTRNTVSRSNNDFLSDLDNDCDHSITRDHGNNQESIMSRAGDRDHGNNQESMMSRAGDRDQGNNQESMMSRADDRYCDNILSPNNDSFDEQYKDVDKENNHKQRTTTENVEQLNILDEECNRDLTNSLWDELNDENYHEQMITVNDTYNQVQTIEPFNWFNQEPIIKPSDEKNIPSSNTHSDMITSNHLQSITTNDNHEQMITPSKEKRTSPNYQHINVPITSPNDQHINVPITSPNDQHINVPITSPNDQHINVPITSPNDQHNNVPITTPNDQHINVPIIYFKDKHNICDMDVGFSKEIEKNLETGEDKEVETESSFSDDGELIEPAPDVYAAYFDDDGTDIDERSQTCHTGGQGDLDQNPDLAVMFIYLLARCKGEEGLLKHLAERNDINRMDSQGRTALAYAVEDKNIRAFEVLLACGAKPMQDEPTVPVTIKETKEIVDEDFMFRQLYCAALAEDGPDMIHQIGGLLDIRDEHGNTVLVALVKEGNFNGVFNLLEAGARVDQAAIVAAQTLENLDIVELLCAYQDRQ